jgi:HlyD family secretion protein
VCVIALVLIGTIVFLYRKSHQATVVYQLDSPARMTIVRKTVAVGKVIPRREIESFWTGRTMPWPSTKAT